MTACPTSDIMILDRLADRHDIERLVGGQPDVRYKRAGLFLPGPNGVTRFEYFSRKPEERVAQLQRRILLREPWHWAYQVDVPKEPVTVDHQRNGTLPATRPITYTSVLDAGLLYRLHDWLVEVAETRLNEVAIAYRPRGSMVRNIREAMTAIRERKLFSVCVLDVRSFYDSLSWKRLHQVVESLPADSDVKGLLHELIEIEVVSRNTGKLVHRSRGIAQGLNVSPVMANLFMAEFDHWVAGKLRRLGAVVRRYADDIAVFAPSGKAAQHAREIVLGHIQRLGLQVKEGTGEVVNLLPHDQGPHQHHEPHQGDVHVPLGPHQRGPHQRGPHQRVHVARDHHGVVSTHTQVPISPHAVGEGRDHPLGAPGAATWLGLQLSTRDVGNDHRLLVVDVDKLKVERKTAEIQAEYDGGLLSRDGVEDRLEGLRSFYRLTLSGLTAQHVVDHIRENLNFQQGIQEQERSEQEEEVNRGNIDPRERRPAGGQDPDRRLSEVDSSYSKRQNRDRWSKTSLHRSHRSGGNVSSGVLGNGNDVEVSRRGGHRPRSPGAPTGTRSATPVPDGIEKLTVRVRPRSRTRAHVVIEGSEAATFEVVRPGTISMPEMYLWATVRAFQGLGGNQTVVLVVTDSTLAGIVWDGWTPHSVPLARALVEFRRHIDRLGVRLERGHLPRRRKRTDGPSPWT